MLQALLLVALFSLHGASASSWGFHLDRRHAHVPSAITDMLHHQVWTPTFPLDTEPAASARTSSGVVDLKFRFLHDQMGTYATTAYIGTPPQPMALALDLMGTDVLVFNHKIGTHRYYDHTQSSTYKANGTYIHYGDVLTGFSSRDTVTLGDPEAKHTVDTRDYLFTELKGRDDMLARFPTDGWLGFGVVTSEFTGEPSIVRKMIKEKTLDEPVVGLFFGEQDAHALVGGVDSMYVNGPISYFPINHDLPAHLWSVPVTGVSVGAKPVVHAKIAALPATGQFIVGPREQVDAIADAVGSKNNLFPCDGPGANITFTIGDDLHVTLTKKDYAIPSKQEGTCIFAMLGAPQARDWFLGNSFMRKVYMVLHYGDSESDSKTGMALSRPAPF